MRIFMIIGKSNTGKDTIFNLISKSFNLTSVIPSTTRPQRDGEKEGKSYYFMNKCEFTTRYEQDEFVEIRSYEVNQEGKDAVWFYGTLKSEFINNDLDYIMIGTPEVYKSFVEKFGEDVIYPFYIICNDKTRLHRAIERETLTGSCNYSEVCRRYLKDEDDFDIEEISKYKNVRITNNSGCYMADLVNRIYELGEFYSWKRKVLNESELEDEENE